MRQVVITRAHNIPKKLENISEIKYHAFVELSDKNMDKNYSRQKSRARCREKNQGHC